MTLDELCAEASKLPEKARGDLAAKILATLGSGDCDVSDEEVLRRVEESQSGRVKDLSFEELKAGLKNLPKS